MKQDRSLNELTIKLNNFKINVFNKGYQKVSRSVSYQITQQYIINKKPFYDNIIGQISKINNSKIDILIPGIGNGPFVKYLLQNLDVIPQKNIYITGIDISKEMVEMFFINNHREIVNNHGKNIQINLYSGVNFILDNFSNYENNIFHNKKYDIILLSQFEQYIPNNKNSDLYKRLVTLDNSITTLPYFRSEMKRLLKKNGLYIIINDFKLKDETKYNQLLYYWDTSIINNFYNDDILKDIENKNKFIYEKIKNIYVKDLSKSERYSLVKERREHRRHYCLEETEYLSDTIKELKDVFTNSDIAIYEHPEKYYSIFKLIIIKKN